MKPVSGGNRGAKYLGNVLGSIANQFALLTTEMLTIATYCVDLATSCHMAHLHVSENSAIQKGRQKDRYYRFNVVSGLSEVQLHDWKELGTISELTDAYLSEPLEQKRLLDCVALLSSEEQLIANVGS
jgi:hypothetical protein